MFNGSFRSAAKKKRHSGRVRDADRDDDDIDIDDDDDTDNDAAALERTEEVHLPACRQAAL